MGQQHRANRTPDQIIRSVISYLEWRAGESWLNFSDRSQRFDQDRLDYLEALRVVQTARYSEPLKPFLPLPALPTSPSPSKQEQALAGRSRAWLVDELVRADGRLTDRRLLSHLGRPKLAHMLCEARARVRRTA